MTNIVQVLSPYALQISILLPLAVAANVYWRTRKNQQKSLGLVADPAWAKANLKQVLITSLVALVTALCTTGLVFFIPLLILTRVGVLSVLLAAEILTISTMLSGFKT